MTKVSLKETIMNRIVECQEAAFIHDKNLYIDTKEGQVKCVITKCKQWKSEDTADNAPITGRGSEAKMSAVNMIKECFICTSFMSNKELFLGVETDEGRQEMVHIKFTCPKDPVVREKAMTVERTEEIFQNALNVDFTPEEEAEILEFMALVEE